MISQTSRVVNQRIIGGGIHLNFYLAGDQFDAIDNRTHVLRQAAQRVAVLNWLIATTKLVLAIQFIGYQCGAAQHLQHHIGGCNLARLWFVLADEGVERLIGCAKSLKQQAMGTERQRQQVLGVEYAASGDRGHHGGAIDHGQAFLGSKLFRT